MGTNCSICFSSQKKLKIEDLRDKDVSANVSVQTGKFAYGNYGLKNRHNESNKSMPSAEMNVSSLMSSYSTRNSGDPNSLLYSSSDVGIEHFKIIKVIGRGSFGKVYLVQKRDSGEYFAMKTLKKDVILRRN